MEKENEDELKTEEENYAMLVPKLDVVFQSLFGKNNPKITKAFIQALLGEKVYKMQINNDKELLRNRPDDKLGILDLQLDINNKEKVDVEVQLLNGDNFVERILYYTARLYSDQLRRGENYNKAKRVVLVAIIDFELEEMKEIKGMESKWKLIETKNRKNILTELIEINIISLKRAKKEYERDKSNKKAQWMLFLDNPGSKEVRKIMDENEDIKEATIIVKEMSKSEIMRRRAFLRKKAIMDEKSIRRAGLKEGIKEGKIEIAKKMLENGFKIDTIANLTELKYEDIEKIKV